ncbi:MAG: VCBS repeat-containing protein [Maribacter sp.]
MGCENEKKKDVNEVLVSSPPLFTLMHKEETNIYFENTLTEGLNANVLMYEYLYNGGGVATGDFNGDDLVDIYFTSNMGENKLYINQGNLKFIDATETSNITGRSGPWKTGVSAADVNGDNKLDLYLCYSGALPADKRKNQLFINIGNDADNMPLFEEKAEALGLASPAFSNQAYFLDYDHDHDLDMILLNHNPKSLPVLNEISTAEFLKKDDPLQGVRLYEQDKGVFKDVTVKAGISGSALTYGLGIGISDLNNDGWVDFYVSNDYTVPDYLYINNGNGTFTNQLKESLGHTSHFSMGNDISDINNDGHQDILTLDMLPEDNHRQKLLLAPDNYEKFNLNLRTGFHYQYMRNMLQLNNGNGTFSEVGQFSGISNTDWSWVALLADYDNDGWKDLFVTNGYYRDYTNLDFINYMENYIQSKGRLKREDVLEIINQMPSSNLSNYIFKNLGGTTFENATKELGLDQTANSNGAAYADLDNDGDLDLIVNNINKPAFIYRNESQSTSKNYLKVKLIGESKNTSGIGSRVIIYNNNGKQSLEQIPNRGYLSTVSNILNFGLGKELTIDSLIINWNSGKRQVLSNVAANQLVTLEEKNAQAFKKIKVIPTPTFRETTPAISFDHKNVPINDFKRQSLLLNQPSHSGPSMAKGDVNNDGLEDIFIGGSNGQSAALFVQKENGDFVRKPVMAFNVDKISEDSDATFFDANNDGHQDLYVVSGGYHDFSDKDTLLQDRLYLGDGQGNFTKSENSLPKMLSSTSTVAANDINRDGFLDLFVGGRIIPGRYPESPTSYILINDGKGNFTNQTDVLAPELQKLGMVTDAVWADINSDKTMDLIVIGEWMPISIFLNKDGRLENSTANYFEAPLKGLWNTLQVSDLNNDGKLDIIAGNMGTNTQFKVTSAEPAAMYFDDFDKNGSVDPIFTYYIQGKSYPYLTRDELLGQLAGLRSKFNSYKSYADATIEDIFSSEQLNEASKLIANSMETTLLLSSLENKFTIATLPEQAQYSPIYAINIGDFNKDGNDDILLLGNNHFFKLRLGKFDANYGTLLAGNGKGEFKYVNQIESGLDIRGAVKSSLLIEDKLILGINNNSLKTYQFSK